MAIKVIASYTEDQIITSDPSQLLAIKKAKKELEEGGEGAPPEAQNTAPAAPDVNQTQKT